MDFNQRERREETPRELSTVSDCRKLTFTSSTQSPRLPGVPGWPGGSNEFLNRRWHDYTGLSVQEGLGWGWKAAIHPDDLGRLMTKWETLLTYGEPGESEARLRRFDGIYRWFLFRIEPLRDEADEV